MLKPTKKSTQVTALPKKNRFIFSKVIPTLRKIQEKKYFEEIKRESEKRKRINILVKKTTRSIGGEKISSFSEKSKRAIKNFIYEKLDVLETKFGTDIPSEELRKVKREAISIIFKIKNSQKSLITKKEARNLIVNEEILIYDYLKPKHKLEINTLIKYNLSLINEKTHLSFEEYQSLKKVITTELKNMNLGYVKVKIAKEEILSFLPTKKRLATLSEPTKRKLLKQLDKEILKYGPEIFRKKNFEKVEKFFFKKLIYS